jgi:hypothetical protein
MSTSVYGFRAKNAERKNDLGQVLWLALDWLESKT